MRQSWRSASVGYRKWMILAVIGVVSLVIFPGTVADASSHPLAPGFSAADPQSTDNLDPGTLATMRHQESLQPALQAIWDEQMKNVKSGFAGVAFEGNGLSLYWKGRLTPGMAAAVAVARRSGAVVVKPASYSEAELQAEIEKIDRRINILGASDIQTFGIAPDGSGLHITRQPNATREAIAINRARHGKAMVVPAEQLVAEAGVSVPVRFDTATEPIQQNSSRYADFAPWNGGGRWQNNSVGWGCTTGFGVHAYGHSYVLTSAHCASPGDYLTASGQYMGPVYYDDWAYDILLIDALGYKLIFDGVWNTSNTKNVNDWGYWAANELVCQSGTSSGTVCNIKQLRSVNTSWSAQHPDSDGDWGYTVFGLIESIQIDGQIPSQDGDSGGPVFTLNGTGVRAKGIASASSGTYFYFQDWGTIISRFAAFPNVNGAYS